MQKSLRSAQPGYPDRDSLHGVRCNEHPVVEFRQLTAFKLSCVCSCYTLQAEAQNYAAACNISIDGLYFIVDPPPGSCFLEGTGGVAAGVGAALPPSIKLVSVPKWHTAKRRWVSRGHGSCSQFHLPGPLFAELEILY